MPIYYYNCKECKETIKTMHSIKELLVDCTECESKDSLVRVPSHFISSKSIEKKSKAGDLVNEKIQEFTQELKDEKKRLASEEYKP